MQTGLGQRARRASAAAAFGVLYSLVLSAPSSADTVAYWRFEAGPADAAAATIADSSGNGLSGTAVNGPVYRSAVPAPTVPFTGAANQFAMEFNGSNQRVFIPDYAELALTQSFTIEAYVFLHGQSGPSDNIVFRGDDRISLDPYRVNVIGTNLNFGITNAANQSATVSAPIVFNTWVHVAAVLDDAAGTMSLYENGVLVNSITTSVRPFATLDAGSSPGVGIGNTQSSNYDQWYDGLMDEVRISNAALPPSQFLNAPEPGAALHALAGAAVIAARRRRRESPKRICRA